jgi:hypothetical protein
VARPLATHRATQTQNKRTQTSMPRVVFESTIPVFERSKTVHAATVMGENCITGALKIRNMSKMLTVYIMFEDLRVMGMNSPSRFHCT